MLNSQNDFQTFIKTDKRLKKDWFEKHKVSESGAKAIGSRPLSTQQNTASGKSGIVMKTQESKNRVKSRDLSNPLKINEIRLEHFQNYKNLRRKMDQAYLKVRNLQNKGQGGPQFASSDDLSEQSNNSNEPFSQRNENKPKKITNPVFTENMRTYTQISQTLASLHAQQVYFGGFYGHNDPISPMTRGVKMGHQRGGSLFKSETLQIQMPDSQ